MSWPWLEVRHRSESFLQTLKNGSFHIWVWKSSNSYLSNREQTLSSSDSSSASVPTASAAYISAMASAIVLHDLKQGTWYPAHSSIRSDTSQHGSFWASCHQRLIVSLYYSATTQKQEMKNIIQSYSSTIQGYLQAIGPLKMRYGDEARHKV